MKYKYTHFYLEIPNFVKAFQHIKKIVLLGEKFPPSLYTKIKSVIPITKPITKPNIKYKMSLTIDANIMLSLLVINYTLKSTF